MMRYVAMLQSFRIAYVAKIRRRDKCISNKNHRTQLPFFKGAETPVKFPVCVV